MERKVVSGVILTLVMMCVSCMPAKTRCTIATVSAHPEAQVGVKSGDWIKVNYTVTGTPSGTPAPIWMKVEFLSVSGTNATARVTTHLQDGTEQSETKTVNVVDGGGTLGTFPGFVVPANLATGDLIFIRGYGNITIAGETARIYAGTWRTVVYASFLHARARYYWDKQTGVLVEASVSSGGTTVTAKATETNLWGPLLFWMEWWFWAIIAAGIVALAGAVYLKKRKPLNRSSAHGN